MRNCIWYIYLSCIFINLVSEEMLSWASGMWGLTNVLSNVLRIDTFSYLENFPEIFDVNTNWQVMSFIFNIRIIWGLFYWLHLLLFSQQISLHFILFQNSLSINVHITLNKTIHSFEPWYVENVVLPLHYGWITQFLVAWECSGFVLMGSGASL